MKKLVALILTLVVLATSCLAFTSCGPENKNQNKIFTVGVCQLVQHPALDQATQGFVDALKAELGDNVTIEVQNASGDTNVCNTIVGDFVSKKVDLIMANATPALQSAYNATMTIPILGTSITEYGVALGTTLKDGVVGGNVSGTSDLAPLDEQADMILEFMPNVKTVPLQLKAFEDTFKQMFQQGNSGGSLENTANDAIFMAGTLISLIPLLIMYFLLQKQFVEGIDKAGLTGQ